MSVKIIYFVHGTTRDNERHIATGQKPGNLSELGVQQCKELRNKIDLDEIDFVISSDLQRAIELANKKWRNFLKIAVKKMRDC